ncbi:MAG: hypothetical protein E7519_06215 [Ruminococcaceae bacterium]|nr:hypothetical protein [Oscillospiraceae bacterium]
MKKLLMILNISIMVLIILTACSNPKDIEQGRSTFSRSNSELMPEEKIPKTMKKKLSDNFRVDAAIDAPETLPKSIRKISAKIKVFENKEKIIKLIFRDEPTTKSISQGAKDREGNSYEVDRLKSASGKRFLWYGNMLNFSSELGYDINEAFTPSEDGNKYPARDLPFMNQEQAKQKGHSFFKLLGITVEANVHVNSLDYETLAQMQTKRYNEFKASASGNMAKKIRPLRKWSIDDDCYALQFKQAFDGISISNQTFGDAHAKTETFGPDIILYYGKQGYVSEWLDIFMRKQEVASNLVHRSALLLLSVFYKRNSMKLFWTIQSL